MRPGALFHLVHGHQGEVDVLEEGGQNAGPGPGVVSHPGHHGFVHLALGGDQEFLTGDEAGDLIPRQGTEVFTFNCNLQGNKSDQFHHSLFL